MRFLRSFEEAGNRNCDINSPIKTVCESRFRDFIVRTITASTYRIKIHGNRQIVKSG